MIQLTKNIWIGDSGDEEFVDLEANEIDVILNVAIDLKCTRTSTEVEYIRAGLIDGPGNPLNRYYVAIVTLLALSACKKNILVCCHTGSRALVVGLMYYQLIHNRGWDVSLEILKERVDVEMPVLHDAHREVFDKIDWKLLNKLLVQLS